MTEELDPIWPRAMHPDAVPVIVGEVVPGKKAWSGRLPRRILPYFAPWPGGLYVQREAAAAELGCSPEGWYHAMKRLIAARVLLVVHQGVGKASSCYRINPELDQWDVMWRMHPRFVWALAERQASLRAADLDLVARTNTIPRARKDLVARRSEIARATKKAPIPSGAKAPKGSRHEATLAARGTDLLRATNPVVGTSSGHRPAAEQLGGGAVPLAVDRKQLDALAFAVQRRCRADYVNGPPLTELAAVLADYGPDVLLEAIPITPVRGTHPGPFVAELRQICGALAMGLEVDELVDEDQGADLWGEEAPAAPADQGGVVELGEKLPIDVLRQRNREIVAAARSTGHAQAVMVSGHNGHGRG